MTAKSLNTDNCTNINVQPAIAIDIGHHTAAVPAALAFNSGSGTYVFELEFPLIQIQLVRTLIGSKKQIGKTVVVDVTNRHAPAVVVVQIIQNANVLVWEQVVAKINPALAGFAQFEELVSLTAAADQ